MLAQLFNAHRFQRIELGLEITIGDLLHPFLQMSSRRGKVFPVKPARQQSDIGRDIFSRAELFWST